ncbi:MAG: MBL fold metallo-hydrolase, partial [Oleiharenicola lentus]
MPSQITPLLRIVLSCLVLSLVTIALGQPRETGPYTLHPIIPGVTRIEDANRSNPAGIHHDAEGKVAGMNNCSDMYLIVGRDKALLIDLSNFITWDPTAVASLQAAVAQEIGTRKLFIAVTHFHGDHTGMLPAFKDDPHVTFWIQTDEFKGRE